MRLTNWLALIPLVVESVVAQHGSVARVRSGQTGIVSHSGLSHSVRPDLAVPQRGTKLGLPPLHPIPPLAPSFAGAPPPRAFSRRWWFYPASAQGVYEPTFPPIQNVIVLAQPNAPAPEPAPAIEPARSSIRDYTWTDKDAGAVTAESPSFAIVLHDGSTHNATAVWIERGAVGFVDTEGRHGRLPLAAVDRESTARVNRARQLKLKLPPPPPPR